MSNKFPQPPYQLHNRSDARIQVNLSWSTTDRRTWVAVRDAHAGVGSVLPGPTGERARDVSDHRYAHDARQGVPTTAPAA